MRISCNILYMAKNKLLCVLLFTILAMFAYGKIAIAGNLILLSVEILGFIESMIHCQGMLKFQVYPLPEI